MFPYSLAQEDAQELADPIRLARLIKQYSQFIQFPIKLWSAKKEAKQVSVCVDRQEGKAVEAADTQGTAGSLRQACVSVPVAGAAPPSTAGMSCGARALAVLHGVCSAVRDGVCRSGWFAHSVHLSPVSPADVLCPCCARAVPSSQIIDEEATKKRQEEADKAVKEGEEKPKVRQAGRSICALLLHTTAAPLWVCHPVCHSGHNLFLHTHSGCADGGLCPPYIYSRAADMCAAACVAAVVLSLESFCQVEPVMKTDYEDVWDWRVENDNKPLWTRNPKEVAETDYNEFFKLVRLSLLRARDACVHAASCCTSCCIQHHKLSIKC